MVEEPKRKANGRPRDPEVDRRILESALIIYGQEGWSGFTIGKVAEHSGVGRSPIYRRWDDKSELLAAAFKHARAYYLQDAEIEHGCFVEQVRAMLRHRLGTYFTPVGIATVRLNAEHLADPEAVEAIWSQTQGLGALRLRQLIHDVIESGILRPDTSVVHLADALEGALLIHVIATPAALHERVLEKADEYVDTVIQRTLGPWLSDSYVPDAQERFYRFRSTITS